MGPDTSAPRGQDEPRKKFEEWFQEWDKPELYGRAALSWMAWQAAQPSREWCAEKAREIAHLAKWHLMPTADEVLQILTGEGDKG